MFDYKSLTLNDCREIFKGYDFKIEPMLHQYCTLAQILGEDLARTLVFHDIGTGKTLTSLWIIQLWKAKKILVVCPKSAFRGWRNDITDYTDYTYKILAGEKAARLANLKLILDIYIINYEGLKCIYGKFQQKAPKKFQKPPYPKLGKEWVVNFKAFIDNFDCVIFDEVHKCMSYAAIQADICYKLSYKAKYAIGITGTPISFHLLNLFNMVKTVDLGECLGNNFWAFRQKYFKETWYNWEPRPHAEEKILAAIAPITTSYTRKECLEHLPEKVPDKIIELEFPAEQKTTMEKMCIDTIKDIVLEFPEGTTIVSKENPLSKMQKMMQIAGGFLYLKKDGKETVHIFKINPKLKALSDVLEATSGKVIVAHQFTEEGRIIEKWAQKNKIEYKSLRGEIKDADRELNFEAFVSDPKIKILIAHPKCASESLDMSFCNVTFFYANGTSMIEKEQIEGRTRRNKQLQKQYYINPIIKNSIDEITYLRNKNKKQLMERVLKFIRNYGRKKNGKQ